MNYYSPAAANAYANPPGPPAPPYGASPAMLPSGYRQTTYYRGPGDGYADDNAGYQGSGAVPPQNAPCLPAANPQPAFQGRTFQQPAEGTWVPKWQPYAPPQQPVQAPQANGNVAPAASSYLPAGPAVVQTRYESGESWGQTQPLQGQSWAPVGPRQQWFLRPTGPAEQPAAATAAGDLDVQPARAAILPARSTIARRLTIARRTAVFRSQILPILLQPRQPRPAGIPPDIPTADRASARRPARRQDDP